MHTTYSSTATQFEPATDGDSGWRAIKLDRATALGLAFCVNACVFVGLSLPSQGDTRLSFLVPEAEPRTVVDLIKEHPQEQQPVPPEWQPKPEPVIQRVLDQPSPIPVAPPQVETTIDSRATETSPTVTTTPGPVATLNREAGVAYGSAPPPIYPRVALKKGLQGTVVLRVLVSSSGSVLAVDIDQSSGHRDLDRAAQRQVASHWQFQPALQDGRAVEAWVRVPLVFKLQRN